MSSHIHSRPITIFVFLTIAVTMWVLVLSFFRDDGATNAVVSGQQDCQEELSTYIMDLRVCEEKLMDVQSELDYLKLKTRIHNQGGGLLNKIKIEGALLR